MRLAALASVVVMFFMPSGASAAGGVWCDAEDAHIVFHFSAASSRDGTAGWFNVAGSLKIKSPATLPADLAEFRIDEANLGEHWWDNKDVRLKIGRIGAAAQNFASVQLVSIASAVEEADYRGGYELRLTLPDGTILHEEGAVACSAD